jgi:hypothetical protein
MSRIRKGSKKAGSSKKAPTVAAARRRRRAPRPPKLYFGNLPYNCDSALLAGIVQDYASPEMVEVCFTDGAYFISHIFLIVAVTML